MPLIRRIVPYGKTSRGVILPKSWLRYYEKQNGQTIREVAVEVNGKLTIQPILKETAKNRQNPR
jgi:hypothetical protein